MLVQTRRDAIVRLALAAVAIGTVAVATTAQSQMSFFITSAGPGNGANLGGLSGADAHCQALAKAAQPAGK